MNDRSNTTLSLADYCLISSMLIGLIGGYAFGGIPGAVLGYFICGALGGILVPLWIMELLKKRLGEELPVYI